jgi:hypothetical protein
MNTKDFVPEANSSKMFQGIEHFQFEEDFIEKSVACIPMVVRFKLDKVGIKLKLSEWSRFSTHERVKLANQLCKAKEDETSYRNYVKLLVIKHTKHAATEISIEHNPAWSNLQSISMQLQAKAKEFGWEISLEKWGALTNLQRFALIKLCRPGHENRNFPKAMKEFGII